ncbi:hypothetical protein WA026_016960, partial [Henosepilachna vigintioctopunctata]
TMQLSKSRSPVISLTVAYNSILGKASHSARDETSLADLPLCQTDFSTWRTDLPSRTCQVSRRGIPALDNSALS